jgi:2-methylcitrate dehydratase PrpD
MLRLVQKRTISALEVETIACDLRPYPLVRMSPKRGFEGRFSMPFCLAMALIYGRLNPEDFTDERVEEPLTQEVMRRTRHVPGSISLIVILKDGTQISEPIQPARDLTGWDEVAHKFNQCVSKTTPDRQRLALLNLVARLEEIPSVRSLTELLHAQTN